MKGRGLSWRLWEEWVLAEEWAPALEKPATTELCRRDRRLKQKVEIASGVFMEISPKSG